MGAPRNSISGMQIKAQTAAIRGYGEARILSRQRRYEPGNWIYRCVLAGANQLPRTADIAYRSKAAPHVHQAGEREDDEQA
jgi:hypothetical protein